MRLAHIKNPVAYFCSEIAIDNDLPTYSGGLGILASDVLNAAASSHFPMVGIGILYKGKSYIQHITGNGREEKRDSQFDHDSSFLRPTTINGVPLKIKLPFTKYDVFFKSYHLRLSDTTILFFLSTNVDGNSPDWIADMQGLYQGDENSQIRQQILLGVGGVKLLNKLEIKPTIYHINEGRPAFLIWELTKNYMQKDNLSFDEAWNKAKEKIVYTNHTLVAAGNPNYPSDIVRFRAKFMAKEIGVEPDKLIKDGLTKDNKFSITKFALNISKKQSVVSKVHGEYTKKRYPKYKWKVITNGIHLPRWQDSDFRNPGISDHNLWNLHLVKKKELMETVKNRTGFGYDVSSLVITWARRLAQYKQPKAIFKDLDHLEQIVKNKDKPVQILFAGNTHSADPHSKSLIEDIIEIFSTSLSGHAIFVPNYNISLANHLVSGSDVWLNTPKGNLEACGTSGMKAISNGVLNCTVLDGWTYEVDWKDIGWNIDPNNISGDFYRLLETEIIPLFYDRSQNGLSIKWVKRMRKSIALVKDFSADKMLNKYSKLLYQ